jgi:hypothetical protein
VGGDREGSRLLERRSRIPVGFIQLAAEAGVGGWYNCGCQRSEAVRADDGRAEGGDYCPTRQ